MCLVLVEAEPHMIDTAGLKFIVSTPAKTLDKYDRKAIRSHATRTSVADRQTVQLRSWISPDHELGSFKKALLDQAPNLKSTSFLPSPRRLGGDFSGLQLPSGVEPYMIQDLVKCIQIPIHILTHWPLKRKNEHTSTKLD